MEIIDYRISISLYIQIKIHFCKRKLYRFQCKHDASNDLQHSESQNNQTMNIDTIVP